MAIVTNEMIVGWNGPGISPANDMYHSNPVFMEDTLRRYNANLSKTMTVKTFCEKLSEVIS